MNSNINEHILNEIEKRPNETPTYFLYTKGYTYQYNVIRKKASTWLIVECSLLGKEIKLEYQIIIKESGLNRILFVISKMLYISSKLYTIYTINQSESLNF